MNSNVIRTIYLSVITLISIGCVIAGVAINLGGFSVFGIGDSNVANKESYVDSFDSISIDANVMEVTLKRGENYSYSYEASSNIEPIFEVKNRKLVITQSQKNKMFGNNKCDVIITIPNNKNLELISADIDVGDVNINDCEVEDISIACDVGNVNIKDGIFEKVDVDTNIGDVTIDSSQSLQKYSVEVKSDIGEVTVFGEGKKREYTMAGEDGIITVKTDIGDIDIEY